MERPTAPAPSLFKYSPPVRLALNIIRLRRWAKIGYVLGVLFSSFLILNFYVAIAAPPGGVPGDVFLIMFSVMTVILCLILAPVLLAFLVYADAIAMRLNLADWAEQHNQSSEFRSARVAEKGEN